MGVLYFFLVHSMPLDKNFLFWGVMEGKKTTEGPIDGVKLRMKKIFEPINIGSITLKNRIEMGPMRTIYGGRSVSLPLRLKNHFRQQWE